MTDNKDKTNYVVVSVPNLHERDRLIKSIYTQLTSGQDVTLTVVQDTPNKIKVFHNTGKVKVLIRVYLVIVISIQVNLDSLKGLYGTVNYYLDNTIDELLTLIKKLQSLNGQKVLKGSSNEQVIEELVRGLSTLDGGDRAS